MLKIYIIFLLFFYLLQTSFTQEKIIIGVPEAPPYYEEKLSGYGMVCELLTSAFEISGYEVQYKFLPLTRLYTELIEGNVDGIPYGFGNISAKDQLKVIESKPIYLSENVLFYKIINFPNGVNFKDLSELKNHTVGVKNGNIPMINLLTNNGLKVDTANTADQLFIKLNLGRTDFVVAPDIGGIENIKNLGLKQSDFAYTKYIVSSNRTMMFSKITPNNDKIFSDFNKGYKIIMKNGTYKKILEKYYGKGKIPASVLKLIEIW
jgi:polar amino acid transport system substrate-binding protein